MAAKADGLEQWRNYFRGADSDIFDVIEHAIIVAASDCPKEFKHRRDRIAEMLFSCRLTRCVRCDRVEVAVPEADEGGIKTESGVTGGVDTPGSGAKESKITGSVDDHGELNQVSNYSYNEAEALTEELEEKDLTVGEVLRIKDILINSQDQSDGTLYESLRKLQLMELSVGTLKMTEIGKAVNVLRKHGSKQIRQLAKTLINGWKDMVDEWLSTTTAIAANSGTSPDLLDPCLDDGGLPSPPLDEGALLATQTTSIELSQFFDGMDEIGNIRNSGESDVHRGGEPKMKSQSHVRSRTTSTQRDANEQRLCTRKQDLISQQEKPTSVDSMSGRLQKPTSENRLNGANNPRQQQLSEPDKNSRRQPSDIQDKSSLRDEEFVLMKLEAAKRKLHEGYMRAENAKRQRTVQVMELHDLPKQGTVHRTIQRHVVHNRNFSQSRR